VELTNEDVADILALLDSLPYDSLDVETPRFRLTLRRAPGGGWTEESQVMAEPTLATSASDGADTLSASRSGISEMSDGRPAQPATSGATDDGDSDDSHYAASEAAGLAAQAAEADGLAAVAAPLPGTFYRAPRPGADPFVRVGDEVSPDTVVAIIETMKLMNSVHAAATGRVARICVDNGEFAPLGTTLMLIEPAP
jgi:acetyl-CoA carboxylase biotin carboxyl carrier protein